MQNYSTPSFTDESSSAITDDLSRLSYTGGPSSPSGRLSTGMTPDESRMVGDLSSGLISTAATGVMGYLEAKDLAKMKAEDKEEFLRTFEEDKKKQRQKNLLNKQTLEAQQTEAMYNQWENRQNLRHTLFQQRLKQRIEGRQKLISGIEKIKESISKNADIRNIILNSFRRK